MRRLSVRRAAALSAIAGAIAAVLVPLAAGNLNDTTNSLILAALVHGPLGVAPASLAAAVARGKAARLVVAALACLPELTLVAGWYAYLLGTRGGPYGGGTPANASPPFTVEAPLFVPVVAALLSAALILLLTRRDGPSA